MRARVCAQGVVFLTTHVSRHSFRLPRASSRPCSAKSATSPPKQDGHTVTFRWSIEDTYCLNVSYVLVLLLCAFDLLREMDSRLLQAVVPRLVLHMHAALHLVWQVECEWEWRRSRLWASLNCSQNEHQSAVSGFVNHISLQ